MTILHANGDAVHQHLRSVLNEANGQPHSVDIAVGYFYLSGLTQLADLLTAQSGRVHILIDHPPQTDERTVLWYSRNCLRSKRP